MVMPSSISIPFSSGPSLEAVVSHLAVKFIGRPAVMRDFAREWQDVVWPGWADYEAAEGRDMMAAIDHEIARGFPVVMGVPAMRMFHDELDRLLIKYDAVIVRTDNVMHVPTGHPLADILNSL